MAEIDVTHAGGEDYRVEVREPDGSSRHRVTVPPDDLQRYGDGAAAERLLEASFAFLLEREPRHAILSTFTISEIERYFPEYPAEILGRLGES